MNAKHTPGPWIYASTGPVMRDKYSQPFGVGVFNGKHRNLICGCFGDGEGGVEAAEANAKFIAASPLMMEVIEKFIELVDTDVIRARESDREALIELLTSAWHAKSKAGVV